MIAKAKLEGDTGAYFTTSGLSMSSWTSKD
jgi:hypothetical protein